MPAHRTQDACAPQGNFSLPKLHLLELGHRSLKQIPLSFFRRVVMNLDRIFLSRNKKLRAGIIAVALFVSITACKGKAGNPALNFAPAPDAQPQNSYADRSEEH